MEWNGLYGMASRSNSSGRGKTRLIRSILFFFPLLLLYLIPSALRNNPAPHLTLTLTLTLGLLPTFIPIPSTSHRITYTYTYEYAPSILNPQSSSTANHITSHHITPHHPTFDIQSYRQIPRPIPTHPTELDCTTPHISVYPSHPPLPPDPVQSDPIKCKPIRPGSSTIRNTTRLSAFGCRLSTSRWGWG